MPRGGHRQGAGRKPVSKGGVPTIQRWRDQIKSGMLIKRLSDISLEQVDVDPKLVNAQVRAALGLLAKTLPDLQTVQHEGTEDKPIVIVTRAE